MLCLLYILIALNFSVLPYWYSVAYIYPLIGMCKLKLL